MRVVPFEVEMAAAVTRCYNELVAGVPYCCPVVPDRFLEAAHLRILLHQGKTPDARESLRRAPDAVLGSLLNHGLSP